MTAPAIRRVAPLMALLMAVALAACGGGSPAGSTATPVSGASSGSSPSGSVAPGSAPPSAPVAAPASVPTAASPSTGAAVPVDPGLLSILPVSVAGFALRPVPDPSGLDDPALVASLDRLAQAYVIDPAGSGFAYASVIVLRPGVFSAAFFRSWRDSFDEGACSQAGGVSGHAEAQIGGRATYIGTCAGGLLTYHVRLGGLDAIVSVSSLGGAHLGEQLLAGLRP